MGDINQIDDDMSLWMSNTVTRRLLMQVQDEIASINMTIINGDLEEGRYKYFCGRISGLRVVEDFILQLRTEGKEKGK